MRFVAGLLLGTFLGAAVGAGLGVSMADDTTRPDLPPAPVPDCGSAVFILADGRSFLAPVFAPVDSIIIHLLNPTRKHVFRRQATGMRRLLFYEEARDDGA